MTSKSKDRKMKRTTADRLFEGVKERIKEINTDQSYCYRITDAIVFGSYINAPEKDMISDLDIAIRLERRYAPDSPEYKAKQNECTSRDFLVQANWPKEEVIKHVNGGSHYISVHTLGRDSEQDAIILSDQHERIDVGERIL